MRAWLEIDLGIIAHNFERVREHLGGTQICAVVKANAYGHGIEEVARVLDREGLHSYAVISLDEALRVRSVSQKDVLIFGYLSDGEIAEAIENGFILSLYDRELATTIDRIAKVLGLTARTHVKVETGMNRLGMSPSEALELILRADSTSAVRVEAVFTHLWASSRREACLEQLAVFQPFLNSLRSAGVNLPVHMENSHALAGFPEGRFDIARVGLALYGVEPVLPDLKPSLQAKTVIIQRKPLRKGEGTSYNHLFVAQDDMDIAVIAIGYAEGLSQMMTGKVDAIVNGNRVPIIGQISMNLSIIDVTGLAAKRGDVVTLIGSDGSETITVAEMAKAGNIRHHEILTRLGSSLQHVYKDIQS